MISEEERLSLIPHRSQLVYNIRPGKLPWFEEGEPVTFLEHDIYRDEIVRVYSNGNKSRRFWVYCECLTLIEKDGVWNMPVTTIPSAGVDRDL